MRLARAKEEIKSLPDYDYSVVNEFGKQEECADLIYAIMQASHRKTSLTKSATLKLVSLIPKPP